VAELTEEPLRRLGVVYPAQGPPEDLTAFAVGVEKLGLGQLWLVEDCFLSSGMILAASALAVTSRIRVGVGLLPVPLRNPALAAMEIATLARSHEGRLTIALGHGVRAWMDQVGALPTRRLSALEEYVAALRALLAGEPVSVSGDFVALKEVALEMPPASAPDLLVGTTGPRGLDIGERVGDGVLLPEGCGPDFVRWAREGRDAMRRCVVYAWLAVDDDPDVAAAAAFPALQHWAASEHYPFPRELAGLTGPPAPVPHAELGELAARVAIAGDPAACAAGIANLFAAGATDVILVPQGRDRFADLERVVREVRPGFLAPD
jgi:alkanesulfonate monooxygenase SsuD/methylene tetrahydromethanopterin reductase-like flavin-dependent oxidoreductase (luciferase family)